MVYWAPRAPESTSWELALKPIIYNNSSIFHSYTWRSNGYAPLHRTLSLKWIWPAVSETLVLNETKHTKRLQITDQNLRKEANAKMCSFGSCQTRFEFLSQFRKVRNAFECFVTQVQTHLPKTKCVWPMKINVICIVCPDYYLNSSRRTEPFGTTANLPEAHSWDEACLRRRKRIENE